MIETKEFEFPAKDYFRLAFRRDMRIYAWAWAYFSVCLCAVGIIDNDWAFPAMMIFFVIVAFSASAYFHARYLAFAKENNPTTQKRTMKFGEGKYFVDCEDGTQAQGPLTHINKIDVAYDYYRLYINKINYYVVPKSAFHSEEDRMRFETEILGDKLKPAAFSWKKTGILLVVSIFCIGIALYARHTADHNTIDFESEMNHPILVNDH